MTSALREREGYPKNQTMQLTPNVDGARGRGKKITKNVVMSSMDDPLNEWTNCEDNSGISFPSPVQLLGNRLTTTSSSIFGYLHLIKYGKRERDTK